MNSPDVRQERSGWRDRWGPRTSIKREALCDGGCQFTPAKAAQGIYFPCFANPSHIRSMLCPDDDELGDFYLTYLAAGQIMAAPLEEMPAEVRGYDGFRSASVAGVGRYYRPGGLPSVQFFPAANIWLDEQPDDNYWWDKAVYYEWRND